MSFEVDMTRFLERNNGRAVTAVRKIGLATFSGVVRKTPVDTGRARANWNLGGDAIDTTTRGDDEMPSSVKGEISRSDAIAAADANKVEQLGKLTRRATAFVDDGDDINISNSLPYARRLEYGWSDQAPKGMVRTTIKEVVSSVG